MRRAPAAPAHSPSFARRPSLPPRCAARRLVPSQRIDAGAWSVRPANLGPSGDDLPSVPSAFCEARPYHKSPRYPSLWDGASSSSPARPCPVPLAGAGLESSGLRRFRDPRAGAAITLAGGSVKPNAARILGPGRASAPRPSREPPVPPRKAVRLTGRRGFPNHGLGRGPSCVAG